MSRRSLLVIPLVRTVLRSLVIGWRRPLRPVGHGLGDELVEDVLADDRHALLGVGKQQQRVPGLDPEQLTRALRDDDLPLLPDSDRAGELPLRRREVVNGQRTPPPRMLFTPVS